MSAPLSNLDKARQLDTVGLPEAAAALLERELDTAPDNAKALLALYPIYLKLAREYHSKGQLGDSLTILAKAIELRPTDRAPYDLLVEVHASRQSLSEAAQELRRRLAQQPDNGVLYGILAKTYEKMGWWVEAQDAAERAIRLNPRLPEPQHVLQRVKTRLAQASGALLEAAERRRAAGDMKGWLTLHRAWAEATQRADDFLRVGALYEEQAQQERGLLRLAADAYRKALSLAGNDGPTCAEAERCLRRATLKSTPPLSLKPDRLYAEPDLRRLYEWFIQCEDVQGAITYLTKYWARHEFVPALGLLARAYYEAGQLEQALQTYSQAIEKANWSSRVDWSYERGLVYLAQGDKAQARAAFRETLRLNPRHDEARQRLAVLEAEVVPPRAKLESEWRARVDVGQFQRALEYFEDLVVRDPDKPELYEFLARTYEKMGKPWEAYRERQNAAHIIGDDQAFFELGEYCRRRGMKAQAYEAYQKALDLNPHNERARRQRDILPDRFTEDENRLKARQAEPDDQYLQLIWQVARKQPAHQAALYFAALAEWLPDRPLLFSLLGQARKAQGQPEAAALVYRHKAALEGTAHEYRRLGDFCYLHMALVPLAVESYQLALALNPFLYHARHRLTQLRSAQFPAAAFITGTDSREEAASKLCENPSNQSYAAQLRAQFIEARASPRVTAQFATATYRHLQALHPDEPLFVLDLARVYLACGAVREAWREASRGLTMGTPAGEWQGELEEVVRQAQARLPATPADQPPDGPAPAAWEELAETIAIEFHQAATRPGADSHGAPTSVMALRQRAREYRAQAQRAGGTGVGEQGSWLTAARLYQQAGQPDEARECLISYGQSLAAYRRSRQDMDLAHDLALETLRLAVGLVPAGVQRHAALIQHWLKYVRALEREFGAPSAWPPVIQLEVQDWLAEAGGLVTRPVAHLLSYLGRVVAALQSPGPTEDLERPPYVAAIVRRQAGQLLRAPEADALAEILDGWLATYTPPQATPSRTWLDIELPTSLTVPPDAALLTLPCPLYNNGLLPADCVWVTLTANANPPLRVNETRQFIPFLAGGQSTSVAFQLAGLTDQTAYVEVELEVSYFNPVEKQPLRGKGVVTLLSGLRPFVPLPLPPAPPAAVYPAQASPPLLTRAEVEQRLSEGGLAWTAPAKARVVDLCGGDALTLDVVRFWVVRQMNQAQRTLVLPFDVETATTTLLAYRHNCRHFEALLQGDQLTPLDKLLVACLARHGAAGATEREWLEDVKPRRSSVSGEQLLQRLEGELGRLALVGLDPQSDEPRYRFRVGLFREWLYRHWPPSRAAQLLRQQQWEQRKALAVDLNNGLDNVLDLRGQIETVQQQIDAGQLPDRFQANLRIAQLQRDKRQWVTKIWQRLHVLLTAEECAEADHLLRLLDQDEPMDTLRQEVSGLARRRGWSDDTIKARLVGPDAAVLHQTVYLILGLPATEVEPTRDKLDPVRVRRLLKERCSLDEIKDIAFDLRVSYEEIKGDTLSATARGLIEYIERRARLPQLVETCERLRPDVPWRGE